MSYTKDVVIDTLNEIDDEEMRDSLLRLHKSILDRDAELTAIASKCSNFLEFYNIVKDWFRGDEVSISRNDLVRVWDSVQRVDDLITMRKED